VFQSIDRQWPTRMIRWVLARTMATPALLAMLVLAMAAPALVPTAARAETRTLKLYYTHTREKAEVTFKRNGRYLPDGLKKASHMMRDWRRNEPTKMDPKMLDLLWEVYKEAGGRDYIHIVSGYRSPATNSMLRRTRGGQAEKSQHMVGKAVDFFIPGVKLSKLRAIALRKQGGGVGYYPRSGSPFVHIDTGRVRHWPRMSRSELVSVFPNGKTLHVPTDGKPLPGYEQALAAYKANGRGETGGQVAYESDKPTTSASGGSGKTLLGMLFGGGADESEDEADSAAPVAVVAEARPQKPREQAPIDVAALQPAPMDVAPEAESRPVPPADVAATDPVPAPEPLDQYAALPNRGAPVPSPAPRGNEAEPGVLGEAEIAALAAADVTPQTRPDAAPDLAALAPAESEGETSAFDALLPGEAPVPQARPDASGDVTVAALSPAEADALAVDSLEQRTVADDILAPVPSPRPDVAPAAQRTGRVTSGTGPVPSPTAKAERVTRKPAPALAALAPTTAPKTARVVKPALIPQLPVDSSRFGPRAPGDASVSKGAPVQKLTAANENAKALDRMATASIKAEPGVVLEDGSVLIQAGKIPLGD
jgi:uncharacterized protein YcbK (DUF882 family)